jgi:hypothetical protein
MRQNEWMVGLAAPHDLSSFTVFGWYFLLDLYLSTDNVPLCSDPAAAFMPKSLTEETLGLSREYSILLRINIICSAIEKIL